MIIRGDARSIPLADGSVQCVVTSPPYWGLRDYSACGCVQEGRLEVSKDDGRGDRHTAGGALAFHRQGKPDPDCVVCGGSGRNKRMVDAQIGLEPTPELYVATMVAVFREVWRVLKDDGTVWLNLGDSYTGDKSGGRKDTARMYGPLKQGLSANGARLSLCSGLKPKDLCGIPWRVAFALQADGWYLRSDIIWAKPNPMPESVTDRPTRSHEYLFLLSNSERYYYDADAIREPYNLNSISRYNSAMMGTASSARRPEVNDVDRRRREAGVRDPNPLGRNRRDVWTINSEAFSESHFATFPQKLVEPCILAGSRAGDVVLDPFFGNGTVGKVAERFGRRWVGLELSPQYIEIAQKRTAQMGLAL